MGKDGLNKKMNFLLTMVVIGFVATGFFAYGSLTDWQQFKDWGWIKKDTPPVNESASFQPPISQGIPTLIQGGQAPAQVTYQGCNGVQISGEL